MLLYESNIYMSSITRPATPATTPNQSIPKRRNTTILANEFKEKFFNQTRKYIHITNISIMKDDITNYRPLTDIQLAELEYLTEAEKIEIIRLYNVMFASIENLIK